METLSIISEIQKTFIAVRNASFKEKRAALMQEDGINQLLDSILEFKNRLKQKTNSLQDIIEGLEKLTWFNDLDEECYMKLNDLISLAKDLRGTLIRQYINLNIIREKDVAKEEIEAFKNTIDDLKEVYEDLESVFFFLPNMPDFQETTKRLSLI